MSMSPAELQKMALSKVVYDDLPQMEVIVAARTRQRLRDHIVGLLARKWTLRIAVVLSDGTKRHSEIARGLPGITQKLPYSRTHHRK